MNVLLVDDEPLVLEQMEYMIQSIYPFWKFYKAADACQALTLNQNHKINLALWILIYRGDLVLNLVKT